MMRQRKDSRGFTLVECVVAVAVGMAVLGAVYAAVWSGQRSATGIDRKVTTGQDARAALEVMAMEMRMASYNPLYAANPWTNIASCNVGDATRGASRTRPPAPSRFRWTSTAAAPAGKQGRQTKSSCMPWTRRISASRGKPGPARARRLRGASSLFSEGRPGR